MHTFKKLPTIQPKTNITAAQKPNGTRAQMAGSNIGSNMA
jgi:hypothetical protein